MVFNTTFNNISVISWWYIEKKKGASSHTIVFIRNKMVI